MTKAELIDSLAFRRGVAREVAEVTVNEVFEAMRDTLVAGGRVEVRGFGTFSVRQYDGYVGRNPKTQNPMPVAPKRLPKFKLSPLLRQRVNEVLED